MKKPSASKVSKPATKAPAKKVSAKEVTKPAQKAAAKKVASVLKKAPVAPKAQLVKPSELTTQAVQTTKPAAVVARTEFSKPVTVRPPVAPAPQGLSMSQVRANLNKPLGNATPVVNDRDVGAPYLRQEPVKTSKGLSVNEVFRHIGRHITGNR